MNRLCLITNATARSICWYIISYLNEQNLPKKRIEEIKSKLDFKGNSSLTGFSLDELLKSFTEKNIYFVELYSHLKKDDRYLKFLEKLEANNRVSIYFRDFTNIKSIYTNFYNRNIYHTSIFCKWMRNDFIDNYRTERNTGVFADEILHIKSDFYKLDEDYLLELKLRECNVCRDILVNSISKSINSFEIDLMINKSQKNIKLTFDILKDVAIYNLLLKKTDKVQIDIYLKEEEWKNCDVNLLLKQKFNLRLIHDNFSFFNSSSLIIIDQNMYFKTDNFFHIPNNDYVNVDAFNVLKYNTIALSDNIEVNSTYAYYVPVTFLHASYDNENGYQTIAKISSYGLTSYITLSCDLSLVPDKLFGFWKSKAEVYKSPTELDTSHDYFDFICIDPNVIKYL